MITKPETIENVVNGGYCVGCGGCAFATNTSMIINNYGEYQPDLDALGKVDQELYNKATYVCPQLNPSQNEDVLAQEFLSSDKSVKSQYIGLYQNVYGGFVKEGEYRNNGTSGGFGTWVGAALFEKGLIDGVIHVKENARLEARDPFFKYGLSTTKEEILKGSRTKYHVIELSEILSLIKERPGKYLLMGLPCMVKAVRRVQLTDPLLRESIKYTVALVCGHLKSINWTLSLGWGAGITPEEATTFKYRTKGPGIPARAYMFTAYSDNREKLEDSANVIGGKFNQGALMLEACNFCDDVVGETADLTIGDAWLPKFEVDSQGTNLLIVRNSDINQVIKESFSQDKVFITDLTEAEAKDAQSGGFRQRREGLSYRLHKMDKRNKWRPEKRIKANTFVIAPLRRIIYAMRYKVTVQSRLDFEKALRENDYNYYKKRMQVMLKTLRLLEISSSASRIIRKKIAVIRFKKK